MDIPLELAFHNLAPSDAMKAAVKREVRRLERHYDHIIGCRHRPGNNIPDVHILLRVPGREIAVTRELTSAGDKKSAVNAYAMLKDAFQAVQQRLKEYRRQAHERTRGASRAVSHPTLGE